VNPTISDPIRANPTGVTGRRSGGMQTPHPTRANRPVADRGRGVFWEDARDRQPDVVNNFTRPESVYEPLPCKGIETFSNHRSINGSDSQPWNKSPYYRPTRSHCPTPPIGVAQPPKSVKAVPGGPSRVDIGTRFFLDLGKVLGDGVPIAHTGPLNDPTCDSNHPHGVPVPAPAVGRPGWFPGRTP
jgi:hypothetical protein